MTSLRWFRAGRAAALSSIVVVACTALPRAPRPAADAARAEEWDYVADDGVRHYVTELGAGDTVVVLHGGWGSEHSGLLEAVRPLTDRFHFVLYDQRGSMRSSAPESTITVQRLVRDLDGLRRRLGQDRITLLAHSMGAALAYGYLARHPDHVRSLVLVAPVRPTNDAFRYLRVPPSDTARLAGLRRTLETTQAARRTAVLAAAGLHRADTASFSDRERTRAWRIVLASRMLAHPERWRELRGGPRFYDPRVGQAIERNSTRAAHDSLWLSFLPALERFTGPVTVIAGDEDFVDPGAALWRYGAARLPRLRLEVVPRAGHLLWIDQPERFQSLVTEGLRRVGDR